MNTRKGKAKFKNFRIILDSGCSSMIVMGRLVNKLYLDKYSVMQWHTQAGNINTNIKVNIYFTLSILSAMNVGTWKFHVNESTKGRYDMILERFLLTELGFNVKLSDHIIEADDGTFKGSTTPMVDLGAY